MTSFTSRIPNKRNTKLELPQKKRSSPISKILKKCGKGKPQKMSELDRIIYEDTYKGEDFSSLAETSLLEVWDNKEDDIYEPIDQKSL